MTDAEGRRPAPQYGEYATPEEQQEIIRRSGGPAGALPAPVGPAPSAAPGSSVSPASAETGVAEARDAASAADGRVAADGAAPVRRGDRIVTIALLAYGLFTVVTTIPQLIDYSVFADTWLRMAGIDAEFSAAAAGRTWGTVAAVVFAVGWLGTAALSWRALTRGRLSWWIAVVGAVVTFLIVSLCMSVPLFNDPAIVSGFLRAG